MVRCRAPDLESRLGADSQLRLLRAYSEVEHAQETSWAECAARRFSTSSIQVLRTSGPMCTEVILMCAHQVHPPPG